jgi:tRNA pseudouridine55 synthase
MNGIIPIDKPAGISSAAAVARVKRMLPSRSKIGHAGTLDPFATGLLILLIGSDTKSCERFMDQPKQYEATIKLGATTPTLDPTVPEVVYPNTAPVPHGNIQPTLDRFVGVIDQVPPIYSALKIGGRPAYARVREGEDVVLDARKVRVYSLELIDYTWPLLQIRVDCGRGTYIRALARDIGHMLGTSGYLSSLRRTRIGQFHVDEALNLDKLQAEGVLKYLTS